MARGFTTHRRSLLRRSLCQEHESRTPRPRSVCRGFSTARRTMVTAAPPFFRLAELEDAALLVHRIVQPTPQYAWPQLARLVGCDVGVKHENHTPIGA